MDAFAWGWTETGFSILAFVVCIVVAWRVASRRGASRSASEGQRVESLTEKSCSSTHPETCIPPQEPHNFPSAGSEQPADCADAQTSAESGDSTSAAPLPLPELEVRRGLSIVAAKMSITLELPPDSTVEAEEAGETEAPFDQRWESTPRQPQLPAYPILPIVNVGNQPSEVANVFLPHPPELSVAAGGLAEATAFEAEGAPSSPGVELENKGADIVETEAAVSYDSLDAEIVEQQAADATAADTLSPDEISIAHGSEHEEHDAPEITSSVPTETSKLSASVQAAVVTCEAPVAPEHEATALPSELEGRNAPDAHLLFTTACEGTQVAAPHVETEEVASKNPAAVPANAAEEAEAGNEIAQGAEATEFGPTAATTELIQATQESTTEGPEPFSVAKDLVADGANERVPAAAIPALVRDRKRSPIDPEKRGGRPRGTTSPRLREGNAASRGVSFQPDIVCRKVERRWELAVELPEECRELAGLELLLSGEKLRALSDRWVLNAIGGELVARYEAKDGVTEVPIWRGKEDYLLFKLYNRQDRGVQVQAPQNGCRYLVVAPENWARDTQYAGEPSCDSEPVAIPGYRAHFFDLPKEGDRCIAFVRPDGTKVSVSTGPNFELLGKPLTDYAEDEGPLFGGEVPRIRTAPPFTTWQQIDTIVLGEEGPGRGKWRTSFTPDPQKWEQELPQEFSHRRSGWFFLRFYEGSRETGYALIDSLDFRFVANLTDIRRPTPPLLPSREGHQEVEIVFVHDGPCTIEPTQKNVDGFKIVPSENGTAVTVPAHPDFDVTHWQISHPQGKPVDVDILVRRIWWTLGEENCEPSHWEDKQLCLAREHFQATSTKVLWLRLPPDWSVKSKVGAGFKGTELREYTPTKRNGSKSLTVKIPLREFSDAEQLTKTTRDVLFEVTVHNGETSEKAIVGCIPAAEHPKPAESWRGIGRKKTAHAEAILRKGTGCITVNGQGIDAYFGRTPGRVLALWNRLKDCLRDRGLDATLDIEVTVYGSSPRTNRQAKAISHAVARALMTYDPNLKPLLQQNGLGGVQPKTISFPGSVAR